MIDFLHLNEAARLLKSRLDSRRFYHSLGVMQTALIMAGQFGVDTGQAAWAGLLHDCARGLSDEDFDQLIAANVVQIPEDCRACRYLYHNFAGAALARRDYGVDDEAILAAIRTHTCGDAGMTALQKIIYIADLIEPTREFAREELPLIRGAAFADLEWALRLVVDCKLAAVTAAGRELPPPARRLLAELDIQPTRC